MRGTRASVVKSGSGGTPGGMILSKTACSSGEKGGRTGSTRRGEALMWSLDEVIRAQPDGLGNREAQRPGRFQVDGQLVVGRLLERQLRRRSALENLVDIGGRAPKVLDDGSTVAHQAAGVHVLSDDVGRRQAMLEGGPRDL